MILLLRRNTVLHLYKSLSQYVGRLESSTNFQGVTDLLFSLADIAYIQEVEHHLPVLFSCCPVCVFSLLMLGLHHCGTCEAIGTQHPLQVFQFLLLLAVTTDSVCSVAKVLDYSGQDPWMVVGVQVDVVIGMSFRLKHQSTSQGVVSLS